MKTVILITLHRRYYEFVNSIKNIKSKSVFANNFPSIFVVWADPDPTRYWLLNELIEDKIIELLITRHMLPGENLKVATTFYEANNIRLGLENVFRAYPNCFCIVQASDIIITDYGFDLMINEMNRGANAVVFYWSANAFHTNCFAISNNKDYWPPFVKKNDPSILELIWKRNLASKKIDNFLTAMSNYNRIAFEHDHISENMIPFPIKYIPKNATINCYVSGSMSFIKIVLNFFRCIILGDCNGKNNC